jgi:hypothetical protein
MDLDLDSLGSIGRKSVPCLAEVVRPLTEADGRCSRRSGGFSRQRSSG